MTKFTFLDWIILPVVWPWATRQSREPWLLIAMLVKFIWLRPIISTALTSITISPGASLQLPLIFCLTNRDVLNWPASWSDAPETGRKRCDNYPRHWGWIREVSICFTNLQSPTRTCAVFPKWLRRSTERLPLSPTTLAREWAVASLTWAGELTPNPCTLPFKRPSPKIL